MKYDIDVTDVDIALKIKLSYLFNKDDDGYSAEVYQKIVLTYGKDSIKFNENSIVITIPFNWINVVGNKVGNKDGNKVLTDNREKILLKSVIILI